ncbi:MAG: MBL fold metallo-hydrolase [Myxococcota bacterium]
MKKLRWLLLFLGLIGAAVLASSCVFAAPRYQGPVSDHFDGERFHNVPADPDKGLGDMLEWQRHRQQGSWPKHVDNKAWPKPATRVGPGELVITFINHATALVQIDGLNILTDPIYSTRASPFSFAGPARVRAPGVAFEDLPPIDAVVVSHNHYDHLDLATLKRLAERDHPKILVGLGNELLLEREGISGAVPLDWHQRTTVGGLEIIAVPTRHWSSRWISDFRYALWAAYIFDSPRAGKVYFAGDTGYGPQFAEAHERYGAMRAALLPIGAFKPEWFMHNHHMSPEDALKAHRDLGAGTSVAIHFGTFPLADDGYAEAPRILQGLAEREGQRFLVLDQGEGIKLE